MQACVRGVNCCDGLLRCCCGVVAVAAAATARGDGVFDATTGDSVGAPPGRDGAPGDEGGAPPLDDLLEEGRAPDALTIRRRLRVASSARGKGAGGKWSNADGAPGDLADGARANHLSDGDLPVDGDGGGADGDAAAGGVSFSAATSTAFALFCGGGEVDCSLPLRAFRYASWSFTSHFSLARF